MTMREVARRLREIAREGVLRQLDPREVERRMDEVIAELSTSKSIARALREAGLKQSGFLSRSVAPVVDRALAQSFIEQSGSDLVRSARAVKTHVAKEVGRVLVHGATVEQVESIVAYRTRGLRSSARAVAVTAQRALSRAVVINNALKAGITEFEYAGKVSSNTRQFCRVMLERSARGRVWTVNEIKRLDNGQRLSALYYCGGYYCVHTWKPRP